MAICGICNAEPSKYKCPSCEVPYCSLACYRPHKAEHEKSKQDMPIQLPPSIKSEAVEVDPNEQTGQKDMDIFSPLLASPEVQQMLASSSLRRHLFNVHRATLEPPPGSVFWGRGGRGRGRGGRGGWEQNQQRLWNTEKGTRAGIGKLRRLREDNTEVEEFVNMVVGLVEKETAGWSSGY